MQDRGDVEAFYDALVRDVRAVKDRIIASALLSISERIAAVGGGEGAWLAWRRREHARLNAIPDGSTDPGTVLSAARPRHPDEWKRWLRRHGGRR